MSASLAIKAFSLRLGSILWLLPGILLTGRGDSLAILLEVLFTLAFLELGGLFETPLTLGDSPATRTDQTVYKQPDRTL